MNLLLPVVATSFFDTGVPGSQADTINKLLEDLGVFDKLDRSVSNILIKPDFSLEGTALFDHLITLTELVSALSGLEKKISVGDSPPNNYLKMPELWQKIGLGNNSQTYQFELVNFEKEKSRPVALYQKVYYLPEPVLETDFFINLTSVRPDNTGRYSGAISNLAGVLPGKHHYTSLNRAGMTQRINVLVDLLAIVKPALTVVVLPECCLDFEKYSAGESGQALMLASTDVVAIDALLSHATYGLMAENDVALSACQAGLGIGWPELIRLKGPTPLLKKISVAKGRSYRWAKSKLSNAFEMLISSDNNFFPYVDQARCDSCGFCIDRCPSKALRFKYDHNELRTVEIEKAVCLLCYRCMESCSRNAIDLEYKRA